MKFHREMNIVIPKFPIFLLLSQKVTTNHCKFVLNSQNEVKCLRAKKKFLSETDR